MSHVPEPPIITCPQWGARQPKAPTIYTGRPHRALFHGTDGHEPEGGFGGAGESREEAIAYAREIQHFHMDTRGWNDTGQNFTVTRSGLILVGRWHSLTAIRAGVMVLSAHCPGENDQPGVEFEHVGNEPMPPAQFAAGAELYAYICSRCHIRPTAIWPHSRYYPTDCPTNALRAQLPHLRLAAARIITAHP